MSSIHRLSVAASCAVLALGVVHSAIGQEIITAPAGGEEVGARIDSGFVRGTARGGEEVVFESHVHEPGAAWVRLSFDDVQLAGVAGSGTNSVLRLTSLLDGAVQELDGLALVQWGYSSAYFNGDTVLIELVARGEDGINSFRMSHFTAGPPVGVPPEVQRSICGGVDNRELSDDPRIARVAPIGCTAWMIDDCNNCFLTAGHCTGSGSQVVQFNVPLSNPNGSWNHPHPDDQYPIDQNSMQTSGSQSVGNDWAYFGAFANSNTGLRAAEAQGAVFSLMDPPGANNQPIRITGYGTVSSPVPPTWNSVQKTHVGPFTLHTGYRLSYATDTTGGNSGSPIIFEQTGQAIGIHTHGGCIGSGGSNNGTSILQPNLQFALDNPLGVCCEASPPLPEPFDLVYPPNGADEIERNPELSWEVSANAWYYRVWAFENIELSNPVVSGFQTNQTSITLPDGFLEPKTTYFWFVEAVSQEGVVVLSSPELSLFTTVGDEPICPADANGDGQTDLADLNIVLANFGASGTGVPGDLSGDGMVGLNDLNLVLAHFGQSCS